MIASSDISIVVPTLNEADNVLPLLARIDASLSAARITYEVIFIDDHSTDNTVATIKSVIGRYPIVLQSKQGKRGKANSLQQGFGLAQYNIIGMIDADLQYPPEAIAPMLQLLQGHNSDIVITNRVSQETSKLRKLTSAVFNLVFVKWLFGFDYDTQSGLKLFRKSVLSTINLTPRKWSFDLEFIVRALEENYKILQYDIPFVERHSGSTKLNVVSSTYEFITQSLKLRLNSSGKRLRQAYQSNVLFMQQAVGTLLVVIAIGGITSLTTSSVHAVALGLSSYATSAGVTKQITNRLQDITTNQSQKDTDTAATIQTPVTSVTLPDTALTPTAPVIAPTPVTPAAPAPTVTTTATPQAQSSTNNSSLATTASQATPLSVGATTTNGKVLGAASSKIVYPALAVTKNGKPIYASQSAASSGAYTVVKLIISVGIGTLIASYVINKRQMTAGRGEKQPV